MAIRIPWDDCEAAYLLYELIRVLNNEISRNEAIQLVSNALRKRALKRGVEIDDVFRNINGITLQMSVMEYIYTDGKHGLKKTSMPKLFQHVVDLYKFDRNSYEILVKEVVVMPSDKTIEEQFYTWLSTQVSPSLLSDLYTAFRDISSFCLDRKILNKPLFETVDLSILNNVRLTVDSNKVFRLSYKRQLTKMSTGMRQYIAFIKAHPGLVGSKLSGEDKPAENKKDKAQVLEAEGVNDKLIQLIIDRGLTYVDHRNKNGCLWVIGGADLSSFAKECQRHGVFLHYIEVSGSATFGKPAWWTKDTYKDLDDSASATISNIVPDNQQEDGKTFTFDFANYDGLSFTKPVFFSYFGEEHSPLDSWKQLYVEVIRCLYEDYPNILSSYINKNVSGQGQNDFADDACQRFMTSPKLISNGLYLETNLSATDILSKIKSILDICRVDYENLEIQYIVKATESLPTKVHKPVLDMTHRQKNVGVNADEGRKIFLEWMQNSGSANATIRSYISAIGQCTRNAQQFSITESDLFDIVDVVELFRVRDELLSVYTFKQLNEHQHNRFLSAMNKLIAFRQESGHIQRVGDKAWTIPVPSSNSLSVSNEIKEKYEHILSTYFGEDGYQPGRAIFRGRFKRFYNSEYGIDPSESYEHIDELLQMVGTTRDGRVFPKQDSEQNDLIREIIEDILSAFEGGASGIYIEAVFNKYQLQLAENLQIYNMDALIPLLLANGNGKFTQKYSYFVKKWENADSASDILKIMQSFQQPQNYEAIHEKAWYIPYNKMKTLLVLDKSIVNVAPETYFYAPNLPISSLEVQQLISVIQTELEYRSYITDVELMNLIQAKCPTVALNTDGFTTYGLRNCLGYILRDQFAFNGPIISQLGKEISMSDVYAEFARNHQELSLGDLKRLSWKMNIGIYWDSVLKEMVRVSEQKMIRRDLIDFDEDLIDDILDRMCPEQYISIKDVNLFLQFPNIGYAWNHYVLESYLFKNSRKFKLLHVSFGQDSVCGAMVRVDSNISDYRTLIVDALSKSDALGSTKEALQYIVDCGYQHRRRYDGIEQLIKEARLIKEHRENEEK